MDPITIPIAQNITNVPTDLGSYVSNIVGAALMIAALATFIFLVWGGIQWITAGGDKGKTEEARNRITGAIVGLAVTAAAWAIFLLVDYFFGLGMTGKGSTSNSFTTTQSTTANHLANFTGEAKCPCQYNGCAAKNAYSQTSGPNNCKRCDAANGWVSAAPGTCNAVITCGKCP